MDRAAVEELYQRYGPIVLRRARALLGDAHAAQDAMHEVFLRALRAGSAFRGDASPMTWLYRITTNYCLNQIRDQTRRRDLHARHMVPVRSTDSAPMESRLVAGQLLEQIPEELREIAVYYYVDGLNHAEIADLLGISRRTVGSRLDSLRQLVRTETPARKAAP